MNSLLLQMINLPVSIMLMKLFAEQGSLDNQIILVLVLENLLIRKIHLVCLNRLYFNAFSSIAGLNAITCIRCLQNQLLNFGFSISDYLSIFHS